MQRSPRWQPAVRAAYKISGSGPCPELVGVFVTEVAPAAHADDRRQLAGWMPCN